MPIIVVDHRFDPPIDASQFKPKSEKLSPCLPTFDIDWVTSILAADGSRMLCVYDAPDAEVVRRAYRLAQIPFVEVWSARRLPP